VTTFILILAVIAMAAIAFEEVIHLNKAKSTLFLGCVSWMALFIHADVVGQREHIQEALNENLLEIAFLWCCRTPPVFAV